MEFGRCVEEFVTSLSCVYTQWNTHLFSEARTKKCVPLLNPVGLIQCSSLVVAISSKRFQVASRLLLVSSCPASSSWYLRRHSSKSSGSTSEKIFRTLRVRLCTAWFQWFLALFSNAGKIIGSMTARFCLIRFSMWLLFHRKRALSATCRYKNRIENEFVRRGEQRWEIATNQHHIV